MADRLKSIDSAASTVSMTAGLLESARLDRVYSRSAGVAQLPASDCPRVPVTPRQPITIAQHCSENEIV